MARSKARKIADLISGNTFDDGVISASEVVGLGTAATTAATDYATAGQGTLAASALQPTGDGSGLSGILLPTGNGSQLTAITGTSVLGTLKPTIYQETYIANTTGATTTLDLATGTNFSVTLSENTTFVFSNPPATGTAYSFTLVITQPAAAKTITWPASVDWAAATAPDAPGNSEVNAYGFMTRDGGTTYYGFLGGAALG